MTKSQLFQNAHKIARSIRDITNTYKEAFALGLKLAWAIARGEIDSVEQAVEIARVGIPVQGADIQDGLNETVQRWVGNVA